MYCSHLAEKINPGFKKFPRFVSPALPTHQYRRRQARKGSLFLGNFFDGLLQAVHHCVQGVSHLSSVPILVDGVATTLAWMALVVQGVSNFENKGLGLIELLRIHGCSPERRNVSPSLYVHESARMCMKNFEITFFVKDGMMLPPQKEKNMKHMTPGYILPSAVFTPSKKHLVGYDAIDKQPEVGDVLYGKVIRRGQHTELENKSGRIHQINDGSRSLFVFGNRYTPDAFEAEIPEQWESQLDLVARSGLVAKLKSKNAQMKDPTLIKPLGYVVDAEGKVVNTKNYSLITPKTSEKKDSRAKLILVVGTSMNSGKSLTAASIIWSLASAGHEVRGSKITGTSSLKDILRMEDAGASHVSDFSYLGYPSTYLLPEVDILHIFNSLDLKYANNSKNYWVVEIADGILQRETAMLLMSEEVRSRIHKLVFAARDSLGAIGGLKTLESKFSLIPDAVSGYCSGCL